MSKKKTGKKSLPHQPRHRLTDEQRSADTVWSPSTPELIREVQFAAQYVPEMVVSGWENDDYLINLIAAILKERGDWSRAFKEARDGRDVGAAMVDYGMASVELAFAFGIAYGIHVDKGIFLKGGVR